MNSEKVSIFWVHKGRGMYHKEESRFILGDHPALLELTSFTLQTSFVNVLSRARSYRKRMNAKLLSISMALPMLLIGAGQSFGNLRPISPGDYQSTGPTPLTSQVKLDTQQPPPLFLAAKDDKQTKDECSWLGICGDTQK